jgi:hypothetical protein
MGKGLFTDEDIATVARGIGEERGLEALTRDAVREQLSALAAARGVEHYRGDTTRIWRITEEVKKKFAQTAPVMDSAPPGEHTGLPPTLRRMIDAIPEAISRELVAAQGAGEQRALLMIEAANQSAELRERDLRERIAQLEAEVELSCRSSDDTDEALGAAEEEIRALTLRLERCEEERREMHAAHSEHISDLREEARRAQESRAQAEAAAQTAVADLRQLQGRSEAEREARERAESAAVELRERAAASVAELERLRAECATLAAECNALRRDLALQREGQAVPPARVGIESMRAAEQPKPRGRVKVSTPSRQEVARS